MSASLEVVVGGRWLSLDCLYGIDEMSTVWPGGSDQLSWTPSTNPPRRLSGDEQVDVYFGGYPVWSGNLSEPDASQEQLTAVGAWYQGQKFFAFDSSHDPTDVPDTAITQGIVDGLTWVLPASIRATGIAIDISQGPVQLSTLLDTFGDNTNVDWGVDAFRQVFIKSAETVPRYQTVPMQGSLGYALDNYASSLVGRFVNLSGAFISGEATDDDAESKHGPAWEVVDLTGRGEISLATAQSILTTLLAKGRSTPQWTEPITLNYGDILTTGGTAVALETVSAGHLLRVHGGYDLAQRQNGQKYVDVPIGRTSLAGGVLTVTAKQNVVKTFADLAEAAVSRKSA